jgi:wobble nucleotide-excising tRNase
MSRSFTLIGVVVIVFAASGVLFGDDKETKSDAKIVKQGGLPANYGKLGLSDDQKKKIRDIRSEYTAKITDLEEQIKELRKRERLAMENVLTDTQKARLRELVLEKAPGEKK